MKNKLFIAASASAFVLTAATSSFAADVAKKHAHHVAAKAAPVVVAAANPFDGIYAGVSGGLVLSAAPYHEVAGKDGAKDPLAEKYKNFFPSLTGASIGAFAGYNYDVAQGIIVGGETDFSMAFAKKEYKTTDTKDRGQAVATELKQNWLGSTRVRVGYAIDSFMPYIAGGLAYTSVTPKAPLAEAPHNPQDSGDNDDHTKNDTTDKKDTSDSKALIGYTLGAGVDYALAQNILVRAEYRFNDYKAFEFKYTPAGASAADDAKFNFHTNDVRVGIAYKF